MAPLLYVGGVALTGLLGLTAFAWKGMNEAEEAEEAEEEAACELASLLEERRGEYVKLQLGDRKVIGWIVDAEPDLGVVFLDVRKVKIDPVTGRASPKDKRPGPADVEEVTTSDITKVTVYRGHSL